MNVDVGGGWLIFALPPTPECPYASLPGLARAAATSSAIARKGESTGTAIVNTFSKDWQMYSNESTRYLTSARRCGAT